MPDDWTDEELLAGLAAYLRSADPVPPRLVAAAKAAIHVLPRDLGPAAIPWDAGAVEPAPGHDALDHGLARLVFDSAHAGPAATPTRSAAPGRTLTLVAAGLTIELEISKDVLYGQLIPAAPGDVWLRTASGKVTTGRIDDVGHFALRGPLGEPFRLRCRTRAGGGVATIWIHP